MFCLLILLVVWSCPCFGLHWLPNATPQAGIVDEGEEIIGKTEERTAQRDVGLIFAPQKVEHYQIASYGGMVSLAKTLG